VVRSREIVLWSLNEPPRPRLSKERGYFLMARPPSFAKEWNSLQANFGNN